jgi:hypothetical protein
MAGHAIVGEAPVGKICIMRALYYPDACLRNDLTFLKRSIAAYLHYYSSGVQLHNNRSALRFDVVEQQFELENTARRK